MNLNGFIESIPAYLGYMLNCVVKIDRYINDIMFFCQVKKPPDKPGGIFRSRFNH